MSSIDIFPRDPDNRFWVQMFTVLMIALFAIGVCGSKSYSDYCSGFKRGWSDGVCYKKPTDCVAPPAPNCPVPSITEENTYQGGYNNGFQKGREYAKERN